MKIEHHNKQNYIRYQLTNLDTPNNIRIEKNYYSIDVDEIEQETITKEPSWLGKLFGKKPRTETREKLKQQLMEISFHPDKRGIIIFVFDKVPKKVFNQVRNVLEEYYSDNEITVKLPYPDGLEDVLL